MKPMQTITRFMVAAIFILGGFQVSKEPSGQTQAAASMGVPQPELATGQCSRHDYGGGRPGAGYLPALVGCCPCRVAGADHCGGALLLEGTRPSEAQGTDRSLPEEPVYARRASLYRRR